MNIYAPPEPRAIPEGVALRWVADRQSFEDFVTVSDRAYAVSGLPPGTATAGITDLGACTEPHVQTVVAYVDGAPSAAAQVLASHSIAGVYWVGTVPGVGRRGLGDLVTRMVTRRGFEMGARFVTLQASAMGEPIYRRMGFETRWRYRTWARLGA